MVPDPEPEETEVEIMNPRLSEYQIVTAWVFDRKLGKLLDRFCPMEGDVAIARVINGAICCKIVYNHFLL